MQGVHVAGMQIPNVPGKRVESPLKRAVQWLYLGMQIQTDVLL